jgi:hypothetical protein
MAKWAQIKKGVLARHVIEFPAPDGTPVSVALRGLFGENASKVLQGAREYCIARGLPEPMEGDDLYEYGKRLWEVHLGCTDPDSPDHAPELFFASVAEILDEKTGLDPDRVVLLSEAQRYFQESIAPAPKSLSVEDFSRLVVMHAVAPEDARELPFERLPPALRRTFVRHMAVLLLNSPLFKLPTGPGTAGTTTTGASSSSGQSDSSGGAAE